MFSKKYGTLIFFSAVLLTTALSAFWIPFSFPPNIVSYSQSYVVGFSNRVAILLIASISVAVFCFSLYICPVDPKKCIQEAQKKWSYWWLASVCLLQSLWITLSAKLILAHTSRSVEDFTFIPQLQKVFYFHRELYKQVEFAYGPLLFYPTLWLAKLLTFYSRPVNLAYYVVLLIHHLLGLAVLFYLLRKLPYDNFSRTAIFLAVSLYGFNPFMGLNYTLFRFTAPLLFIVLLANARKTTVAFAFAACGTMLLFGLSAEVGIAFLLGIAVLSLTRFLRQEKGALFVILGVLIGLVLIGFVIPSQYFLSILYFSKGYNNLVLVPRPEIVLLLLCAVWLGPRIAAKSLKADKRQGDMLLAFFAVALAMLPAALGVADILHVLGNGVGLLLFGGLAFTGRRWYTVAYSSVLFAVYLLMLAELFKQSRLRLFVAVTCGDRNHTLRRATKWIPKVGEIVAVAETLECPVYVPLEKLEAYIGKDDFVIPWVTDANTSESIVLSPHYQPSYFHGTANSWSADTQREKIAEMRKALWAIVYLDHGSTELPANVNFTMSWPTQFKKRHQVYSDDLMVEELGRNWTPVAHLDKSMVLYKRIR